MAETKHTPTPWRATKARTLIHIAGDEGGVCSISVSPPRVPEIHIREETVARAKADAEFIVRACNAYDDLLAIVEAVASADPDDTIGSIKVHPDGAPSAWLKDAARAAIAKAKGGAR